MLLVSARGARLILLPQYAIKKLRIPRPTSGFKSAKGEQLQQQQAAAAVVTAASDDLCGARDTAAMTFRVG